MKFSKALMIFAPLLMMCLFFFQNCSGTHLQFSAPASSAEISSSAPVTPANGFDENIVSNDRNQIFHVQYPHRGFTPNQIGLIINTNDAQSVEVGKYYQNQRRIPFANVLEVSFPSGNTDMTGSELAHLKAQIQSQMPESVQALVLSWTTPWRVERAVSITSALAMDIPLVDLECADGDVTNYPLDEALPFAHLSFRPTMMLAGFDQAQAKALIDRGIAADGSFPSGDIYLVRTSDSLRSIPRDDDFQNSVRLWNFTEGLRSFYINNSANTGSDLVTGKSNILLYETSLYQVGGLTTNQYLPGAAADTLTSFSGMITGDNWQMSALRWLEAGVTASYGTVTEPCALENKFPQSSTFLSAYFAGDTLLEAYWKSVHVYPQGLFIGEPLAKPFGTRAQWQDQKIVIRSSAFIPGKVYALFSSSAAEGPWTQQGDNFAYDKQQWNNIEIADPQQSYYRIAEVVDDEPPTISSLTPAENQEVLGANVQIQATYSDNSHKIAKIEYYLDSALIATILQSPFSTQFNSLKYSNGNHSLEARAYDMTGNMTKQNHSFIVNNPLDTTPPTLTILSPNGLTRYRKFIPVDLTMRDDRGLEKLEIYDSTRKLATVIPNARGLYKSRLPILSKKTMGSSRLKFVLTDKAGNVTTKTVFFMIDTLERTVPSAPLRAEEQ